MDRRCEIQPLGEFFSQTEDGQVINPCSSARLDKPWIEALEEVRQIYVRQLGEELHSVYVRGSVAFGTAIPGFSDLDSFCLSYPRGDEHVVWQALPWSGEAVERNLGFACSVEFARVTFHESFARVNPVVAMLIKTQSRCIHGHDLSPGLPECSPGSAMMMDAELLERQWRSFKPALVSGSAIEPERVRSMTKRMLRSGFELVMEREGRYATSLYLLYKCFSKYYPEREPDMRWTLETFLNPNLQPPNWSSRFLDFGTWLCEEVATKLGSRFPARA